MKTSLKDMRDWMERLGARAADLVDPPLADDARPLEVQQAIVDRLEQLAEPNGRGGRVLPHRRVVVTVLAPDDDARAALDAVLAELQQIVAVRLREIRCDLPSGFAITCQYVETPAPTWITGQRFAIERFEAARDASSSTARAVPSSAPPTVRITVLRGRATESRYTLAAPYIGVGRSATPIDDRGRTRYNHVAFLEDEADAHGQTVGRAHASIRYDAERGTYQLFDDGSRNGTRIVRDGMTLDVVSRDPVGATVRSGDEIQFGSAAVRVDIDPLS